MNFSEERVAAFKAKGEAFKKAGEKVRQITVIVWLVWIILLVGTIALMWSSLTIQAFIVVMGGAIALQLITALAVNFFYVDPEIRRINNDYPIPPKEEP